MFTSHEVNMLVCLVVLALANAAYAKDEVGAKQLLQFLQEHKKPETLHTSYGYPVTYAEANNGIHRDASFLLNHYNYESTSSFSLERIPPRAVHAYGIGARGYFEVTHDVSNITNVKVFNKIGKKTPILGRISLGTGEIGASEVKERGKGFAVKFYTEEGNMDLLGLSGSVFLVKDPHHAIHGARAVRTNPRTGLQDNNMRWDFAAAHPEAVLGLTQLTTSIGQRKNFRTNEFHAIHTFQVENNKGEVSFVRFNWYPDAGIQSLTNAEYMALSGADPDMHSHDLYDAISNKTYPTWTLYMQVVPECDINKAKFDIFDVTMYWPQKCYPDIPIGKIVLNKHVDNHFAEVEQASFNPANLPPGVRGCDKIFEARTLIYRDSAIHRMGTGYNRIPTNCPLNRPRTYNRDGSPPLGDNEGDSPNYYPNSFNGIVPLNKTLSPRYRPNTQPGVTNLWQLAEFYKELSQAEKQSTLQLVGASLAPLPKQILEKIMNIYAKADSQMAADIKSAIAKVAAAAAATAAKQ